MIFIHSLLMVLFYFINDEPFQSYFHTVLLEDLDMESLLYTTMLCLCYYTLLVNHRSHSYRIVVASFGEKCWFSQFTAIMVFSREDPLYNSLFLYYLYYYTLPKVVIDLSILYGLWSSSRNI